MMNSLGCMPGPDQGTISSLAPKAMGHELTCCGPSRMGQVPLRARVGVRRAAARRGGFRQAEVGSDGARRDEPRRKD